MEGISAEDVGYAKDKVTVRDVLEFVANRLFQYKCYLKVDELPAASSGELNPTDFASSFK